jgi:hypothetical protein
MPRSSRRGDQTGRMAGATLLLLIALAFAVGWFLPHNPPREGYGADEAGPPNLTRFYERGRSQP